MREMNDMEFTIVISTYFVFNFLQFTYFFFFASGPRLYLARERWQGIFWRVRIWTCMTDTISNSFLAGVNVQSVDWLWNKRVLTFII